MRKIFKTSGQTVGRLLSRFNPLRGLRWLLFTLGNARRRRVKALDYILFSLPPETPALPEPRGWLQRRVMGAPPLSLYDLGQAFDRIAADPRPRGIILNLGGQDLQMNWADLQTLRGHMQRLRARGKRVVVYAHLLTSPSYYLASAADEIIMQPGGDLFTIGLRSTVTFLKDALATIGVEVEKIAISPYKSAADTFARSSISPEAEQQLNWLLDERYAQMLAGIADGRGLTTDAARALIDNAPYTAQQAREAGYIDAICNEEGLAEHLGVQHIIPWPDADRRLLRQWTQPAARHIALIRISGTIVAGPSRKPPVNLPIPIIGGEQAGDVTVVRQVRQVMQDKRAAALILFVDSPGGSATASEAMAAALDALASTRPVVIYMNNVAASGGYYVATPGRWIVAQPGTITGSIGVINARAYTQGLFEKLRINRLEYTRGANASLLSDAAPLTEAQRAAFQRSIDHIYDLFTQRVANARGMTQAAVDAVGGGRVWTGAQALEHGLIDELGGLDAALRKARQLADLPDHTPLRWVRDKGRPIGPLLAEQHNPAAGLLYLHDALRKVADGRAQLLMPFTVD